MPSATEEASRFINRLRLADIPVDVRTAAKLQVLDTVGCGIAAHGLGVATEAREAMRELGGPPESTVIGDPEPLPAPNAAFANASLCHGLDFDDTHPGSVSHPGAVVWPAALAAAEAAGKSGDELLVAIVGGTEITARVGMVAPGAFHTRGLHATPICGIFGATAAVARLRGLAVEETVDALGIAGSMASGLLAYLQDGSRVKQIHAGWAAHGAIMAAALAAKGATGPASVLEGRFGLYSALLGWDGGEQTDMGSLGEQWETNRIAIKLFPACHYMHGVLGAVMKAAGHKLGTERIADVLVSVPPEIVPIVLEPADRKAEPSTPYEAKFSLPFSVASLLVHGKLTLASYKQSGLNDRAVQQLAKLVRYESREFATYPAAFPGAVSIVTKDGAVHSAELAYEPGNPGNPLDLESVRTKFRDNTSLALMPGAAGAVEAAILDLEQPSQLSPGSGIGPLLTSSGRDQGADEAVG
jgi:2-methylcitrate dehydratase PrpD